MNECPKTFVKQSTMELIKLVDSVRLLSMKPADSMDQIGAKFMDAVWLIETERHKIKEAIGANNRLQGELNGKVY